MQDYENSFFNDADEFDDKDVIPAIYPKNPYDDEGADNIFGLGNKQKKAERKLRHAEKQLAKGHTRKAQRKIRKAESLLSQVQSGVDSNNPAIDALRKQSQSITSATNPIHTEDMNTDAGQIGSQSGTPTQYAQPSVGGGGGGGDIGGGSMDTGYEPQTNLAEPTAENNTGASDEPTGDLAKVKDLEGVTVTATKKDKTLMLIIIGALVLLAVWYFSKKGKLKTIK